MVLAAALAVAPWAAPSPPPAWAQGRIGPGDGTSQEGAKSLIPPARPPAAAGPRSRRPTPPPDGGRILAEPNPQGDGERYFFRQDADFWPTAVHGFALRVREAFDDFRGTRLTGLDWQLEDIWDYVEERLYAIGEARDAELSLFDKSDMSLALIEEYLDENLEGLAIDGNGAYFMMYREDNPEATQWLGTAITDGRAGPRGYGFGEGGPGPAGPSQNDQRRHGAARDAWGQR
jgi:hypothetical protein